jgi:hypothetical protein
MSRTGWCFGILLLTAACPLRAWSAQGHLATGAIAFDLLADRDPAAVAAIEQLMESHPDRARFDSALQGLEGPARTRRLFELIARWPDDIRGTRYSHVHWHHELRVVAGSQLFRGIRLGEADHGFRTALRILRDPHADAGRRSVALCWLFHITGDMHQPLHAGHLMNGHFPFTDKAGTIGWVKPAADAAPESLHQFWDMAADRSGDDIAGGDSIARAVESGLEPIAPAEDIMASYRGWVGESEQLAAGIAYRGAALDESRTPERAPILPPDYVTAARETAEHRLGQAGARLAGLIQRLFDPAAAG